VGSVDGFRYSGALSDLGAGGAIWSVAEIETWLKNPRDYAPGTKMNFVVRDADQRRLIANWLVAQGQ
jgi:cytochrome c